MFDCCFCVVIAGVKCHFDFQWSGCFSHARLVMIQGQVDAVFFRFVMEI